MSMECILNAKRRVSLLGLELYNHWPRRHLPKRFTLFAGVLSLIFLYFLLGHSFWSNNKISSNHNCIADLLSREGIQNPWGDDADGFQSQIIIQIFNLFFKMKNWPLRVMVLSAWKPFRMGNLCFFQTIVTADPCS